MFHNLAKLRTIKYSFAAWNFLWNPKDTWCLFKLLHASHTSLLRIFIKHRAISDPMFPSPLSPPLVCNKKTYCSTTHWLPHTSLCLSLSPFTRWQSSPQCLSAAGIPSKQRDPMWSICMALMLSPVRAFKALCLFHMAQPSLITVPGLSCDCERPLLWFTMWEPERRRTGAGALL